MFGEAVGFGRQGGWSRKVWKGQISPVKGIHATLALLYIYTSTDSLFYVDNGWKRERCFGNAGRGVTAAPPALVMPRSLIEHRTSHDMLQKCSAMQPICLLGPAWDIPAPDHSSQIEQPALPSFMASKLSHPTENGKGPLLVPHPG